ncbi:MAG: 23S rRNA pseudouridine(2604) synthase RluF [Bacteroidales bacterium]
MRDLIRLNKFISEAGVCSRREADEFIASGRVIVNGKTPEVGMKINPAKDKVKVDGRLIDSKKEPVYLAFNKPVGITCTTDTTEKGNIIEYVNFPERIFNIGRLDKDSEGLIFLTNDGDIVNKILRAGNEHEKEYLVTVDKPVTADFLHQMANGVPILGTRTKKCKVEKESEFTFYVTLTQGLNRQIRRMCEALGYNVIKLKRVRVMHINLKGLPTGMWRFFTKEEVSEMMDMIEASSNLETASRGMGAVYEEREYGWRAARKAELQAKLAEAALNPKSKTLRQGKKKAPHVVGKAAACEMNGKGCGKSRAPKKGVDERPKTKNTGIRMEDAIRNPKTIAAVKGQKPTGNSKSASLRGKAPKGAKPGPRGRSVAPRGRQK